jgi:hypothetical protein
VRYLGGGAAIVVVVAVVGASAVAVRRALFPGWHGAWARLAEAVVGVGIVLSAGQLAGALGVLRPVPVLLLQVGVAGAVWLVARPASHRSSPSALDTAAGVRRPAAPVLLACAVGVSLVAVQWVSHVGDALGRGMTHPDTLWYHQPFAARFVQEGAFAGLDGLGYESARWFPFGSQLLHVLGILAFGNDWLSPLLNLGWLGLAGLAAWCVAADRGVGPAGVLAVAVPLGLPAMAGTQPGQASSDIACAALLLAGVALLLRSDLRTPAAVGLAGVATGLAIGTKVTVAVPVAVLVAGVAVGTLWARRTRVAALWIGGVIAGGSFWFLRNWVLSGTPLPWFDLTLGPIDLPARAAQDNPALAETLFDGELWRELYLPGLRQGLGPAWPAVLAAAIGGAVLALVRGRTVERLVGLVVLAGIAGHVVTPLTGGFSFVFNLRYLAPVLAVGTTLLVRMVATRRPGAEVAVAGLFVLVALGATARHVERVEAWPDGQVLPAVLFVALGIAVVLGLRAASAGAARVLVPAVALLVLAGGRVVHDRYLDHRYVAAGLHMDRVHEHFRSVRGSRVAVFGTDETLPMFGLDLSNDVWRADEGDHPFETFDCRRWRTFLAGRYDHVVLTQMGFGYYRKPPEWVISDDPSAREVVREGDSVAYRLDGPLSPERCP